MESWLMFDGTMVDSGAANDLSRITDAREKGRIGIFGNALSYAGSYGRVTSESIGRDLNPLGRGDGNAYVAGGMNLGQIAPSLPRNLSPGGWGNSVSNGCGGSDPQWGKEPPPPTKPGENEGYWIKLERCRPMCGKYYINDPGVSSALWEDCMECCMYNDPDACGRVEASNTRVANESFGNWSGTNLGGSSPYYIWLMEKKNFYGRGNVGPYPPPPSYEDPPPPSERVPGKQVELCWEAERGQPCPRIGGIPTSQCDYQMPTSYELCIACWHGYPYVPCDDALSACYIDCVFGAFKAKTPAGCGDALAKCFAALRRNKEGDVPQECMKAWGVCGKYLETLIDQTDIDPKDPKFWQKLLAKFTPKLNSECRYCCDLNFLQCTRYVEEKTCGGNDTGEVFPTWDCPDTYAL